MANMVHAAMPCDMPSTSTGAAKIAATIRRRGSPAPRRRQALPSPARRTPIPRSRPRNRGPARSPGSNSTVAVLVARFTLARSTPGVLARVRSMLRAQAAHVIPETGRSTRSGAVVFMRELRSRVGGPRSASASGFTTSASYSTVALALTRSTVALVTPGVAESLRSTLREQLPQVIPLTLIFRVCAAIPI